MDDTDAALVRAELVALQAVMISGFRRLVQDYPATGLSICQAFDEAEATLTEVAMKMGLGDPGGAAVGALEIVEEIRAGVISDERSCHFERAR